MALDPDRIAHAAAARATPTGLHGTNIVSVAALPNGTGGTSQIADRRAR